MFDPGTLGRRAEAQKTWTQA